MNDSEFPRPTDIRQCDGRQLRLVADAAERAALAKRFELVRIERLEAEVLLDRHGEVVEAQGRLEAEIVQSCAVSGEDLPAEIDEPVAFRFVPATDHRPDEELELDAADCDEIEFTGTSFDLGEAVAQSLGLAIDPFATGPRAEEARHKAGLLDETEAGPFAALAALKKNQN